MFVAQRERERDDEKEGSMEVMEKMRSYRGDERIWMSYGGRRSCKEKAITIQKAMTQQVKNEGLGFNRTCYRREKQCRLVSSLKKRYKKMSRVNMTRGCHMTSYMA